MLNSHIIKEGHPKWHWFFSAPCTMTRTCHPTKGYYEGNVVLFAMFNHCVAKPYYSTKQNRFSWLMIEVLGILGWCFCISGQPIPYLPLRHVLELRYKCTKTRAASEPFFDIWFYTGSHSSNKEDKCQWIICQILEHCLLDVDIAKLISHSSQFIICASIATWIRSSILCSKKSATTATTAPLQQFLAIPRDARSLGPINPGSAQCHNSCG